MRIASLRPLHSAGELCGETFGLGSVGARGVPGAALPTGDGVETFVDDGVVAVSLADDVAVHDRSPLVHRIDTIRWNDR